MGKNKAWHAQGPGLDLFDSELRPRILALLANTTLTENEEAPLLIRLYMIGVTADLSKPTVFICCVQKTVRENAESCVRRDGIVKCHGFSLASSALCLEAKQVIVRCMYRRIQQIIYPHILPEPSLDEAYHRGLVGRRVTVNGGEATAGPLFRIHDRIYQLTVAHIIDDTKAGSSAESASSTPDGLDEVCFSE
ncbi:hypothetical protein C8035_v006182 [Colletotrichum spinosum]|uniref:Uncharacterized protein n=1 Tax=Colletotrichum spinosum TaxID=1347390 RepID=A0A4R8QGJ3_9PEZI|nr:hypothetical protein C8035_v006182 [Colletotrichum spinosum]